MDNGNTIAIQCFCYGNYFHNSTRLEHIREDFVRVSNPTEHVGHYRELDFTAENWTSKLWTWDYVLSTRILKLETRKKITQCNGIKQLNNYVADNTMRKWNVCLHTELGNFNVGNVIELVKWLLLLYFKRLLVMKFMEQTLVKWSVVCVYIYELCVCVRVVCVCMCIRVFFMKGIWFVSNIY